jgi:hypothetical protein
VSQLSLLTILFVDHIINGSIVAQEVWTTVLRPALNVQRELSADDLDKVENALKVLEAEKGRGPGTGFEIDMKA